MTKTDEYNKTFKYLLNVPDMYNICDVQKNIEVGDLKSYMVTYEEIYNWHIISETRSGI